MLFPALFDACMPQHGQRKLSHIKKYDHPLDECYILNQVFSQLYHQLHAIIIVKTWVAQWVVQAPHIYRPGGSDSTPSRRVEFCPACVGFLWTPLFLPAIQRHVVWQVGMSKCAL